MSTQVLRPSTKERKKGEWVLLGPWGKRSIQPMTNVELYSLVHKELVRDGILPVDADLPSNRHHSHVTLTVQKCSWIRGKWVIDETFGDRLRRLRTELKMTQEALAKKSGLDVGAIRQLEQGTRMNPHWQTVCALASGISMEVGVFIGTARLQQEYAIERNC